MKPSEQDAVIPAADNDAADETDQRLEQTQSNRDDARPPESPNESVPAVAPVGPAQLKEQLASAKSQLTNALIATAKHMKAERTKAAAEAIKMKDVLEAKQVALSMLATEKAKLETALKRAELSKATLEENLKKADLVTDKLETELDDTKSTNTNLEAKLSNVDANKLAKLAKVLRNNKLTNLEADLGKAELDKQTLEESLKQAELSAAKLKAELDSATAYNGVLEISSRKSDVIVEKLEADAKKSDANVQKLEEDLKRSNAIVEQLEADLKIANNGALASTSPQADGIVEKLEAELKSANASVEKLEADLRTANASVPKETGTTSKGASENTSPQLDAVVEKLEADLKKSVGIIERLEAAVKRSDAIVKTLEEDVRIANTSVDKFKVDAKKADANAEKLERELLDCHEVIEMNNFSMMMISSEKRQLLADLTECNDTAECKGNNQVKLEADLLERDEVIAMNELSMVMLSSENKQLRADLNEIREAKDSMILQLCQKVQKMEAEESQWQGSGPLTQQMERENDRFHVACDALINGKQQRVMVLATGGAEGGSTTAQLARELVRLETELSLCQQSQQRQLDELRQQKGAAIFKWDKSKEQLLQQLIGTKERLQCEEEVKCKLKQSQTQLLEQLKGTKDRLRCEEEAKFKLEQQIERLKFQLFQAQARAPRMVASRSSTPTRTAPVVDQVKPRGKRTPAILVERASYQDTSSVPAMTPPDRAVRFNQQSTSSESPQEQHSANDSDGPFAQLVAKEKGLLEVGASPQQEVQRIDSAPTPPKEMQAIMEKLAYSADLLAYSVLARSKSSQRSPASQEQSGSNSQTASTAWGPIDAMSLAELQEQAALVGWKQPNTQ